MILLIKRREVAADEFCTLLPLYECVCLVLSAQQSDVVTRLCGKLPSLSPKLLL